MNRVILIFLLATNPIVNTSLKADDSPQCLNVDSAKTYTVMSCDGSERMDVNFCVTDKQLDTVNILATLISRSKKDSAPKYQFNQVPYENAQAGIDQKRERNISDGSGCRMFLSIKKNESDITYSFSEQRAFEKKIYQALRVKIDTDQNDSFVVNSTVIRCKSN